MPRTIFICKRTIVCLKKKKKSFRGKLKRHLYSIPINAIAYCRCKGIENNQAELLLLQHNLFSFAKK